MVRRKKAEIGVESMKKGILVYKDDFIETPEGREKLSELVDDLFFRLIEENEGELIKTLGSRIVPGFGSVQKGIGPSFGFVQKEDLYKVCGEEISREEGFRWEFGRFGEIQSSFINDRDYVSYHFKNSYPMKFLLQFVGGINSILNN